MNPRSGGGAAARAGIAERARDLGIEVVVLDAGQSLPDLAEEKFLAAAKAHVKALITPWWRRGRSSPGRVDPHGR